MFIFAEEDALIGENKLEDYPLFISMTSNGNYIPVGTQKGIYVFDKNGDLLWKNNSIGKVERIFVTSDNKYVIVIPNYVFMTATGEAITKFDFSVRGKETIDGQTYSDIFNLIRPFDYYFTYDTSGPEWYIYSFDPFLRVETYYNSVTDLNELYKPKCIKDSKEGLSIIKYEGEIERVFNLTPFYVSSKTAVGLYKLLEIKGINDQSPKAIALNSNKEFYMYNGKVYTELKIKDLDIPKDEVSARYTDLDSIGKYFIVTTNKGAYLFDMQGNKKWFHPLSGIERIHTSDYSQYILVKCPKEIMILNQNGDAVFKYAYTDKIKLFIMRNTVIALVYENGAINIFDLKAKLVTAQDLPKESNTSSISREESNISQVGAKEEIIENKETVNTTETKNTPGFELPSLITGSILVAYILNKRK
jgi:hypothetical protein